MSKKWKFWIIHTSQIIQMPEPNHYSEIWLYVLLYFIA
jgi:hypothetical protein